MRLIIGIIFLFITNISHIYAGSGDVTEKILQNGLKVIVKEDHRAPIAIMQVWYKIGSGHEPNGLTGISHALEHMMFRGTKKYKLGMIDRMVLDNGGVLNAFTYRDFTCYWEMLSANKLPIAFEIEADRMRGLLLDKNVFAKEQSVIIEERKQRVDNPTYLTYERFLATAFVSNPYRHPVLGWMHDIKNLTTKDLYSWYKKWYAPNNATIVVVGDVKPKDVFVLAKKYFGHLKSENIDNSKTQKEVESLGERRVVVKAHAEVSYLDMGYNVPSLNTIGKKQKWKIYALSVLGDILSEGPSSRLNKKLIKEKKVAASVSAYYDLYSRMDSLFVLNGTPARDYSIKELKSALLGEIKELQEVLVNTEELERVKVRIRAQKVFEKDSVVEQATEIGWLESVGLSWKDIELYIKNIEAVTPEQIQSVAKEYLISDRLTVAELKPTKRSSNKNDAKKNSE